MRKSSQEFGLLGKNHGKGQKRTVRSAVDLYGPCWKKEAFGLDTIDG